jgi:hypothetical protein
MPGFGNVFILVEGHEKKRRKQCRGQKVKLYFFKLKSIVSIFRKIDNCCIYPYN